MPTNSSEPDQAKPEYRISVRFGDDLLQAGFTAVPNLLLNHYAELGLNQAELVFVIHLCQYQWTEKNPYPSLQTIATKMGKDLRQTRRYAESLRTAGLLVTHDRSAPGLGQITSEYDLSNLFTKLRELGHLHGDLAEQTPRSDLSGGGRSKMSGAPQSQMSYEEYSEQSDEVFSNAAPQPSFNLTDIQYSKFRKGSRQEIQKARPAQTATSRLAPTLHGTPVSPQSARQLAAPTTGMTQVAEVLKAHGIPFRRAATETAQPTNESAERLFSPLAPAKNGARPRPQVGAQDTSPVDEQPATHPSVVNQQARQGSKTRIDAEDREAIQRYLGDFAPEFSDQAPFKSTVSRVCNIYADSGLTMSAFVSRLYAARSRTKATISEGRIRNPSKRFAYFCALLEEECGLREPPPEIAAAAKAKAEQAPKLAKPARERGSLAGRFAHLVQR